MNVEKDKKRLGIYIDSPWYRNLKGKQRNKVKRTLLKMIDDPRFQKRFIDNFSLEEDNISEDSCESLEEIQPATTPRKSLCLWSKTHLKPISTIDPNSIEYRIQQTERELREVEARMMALNKPKEIL